MKIATRAGAAQHPWRRPLVLVEDDGLDPHAIDMGVAAALGVDVVVCSGPAGCGDVCPLVMDGTCPAGRPDVVVTALSSEWHTSVENAWRAEGVPVVRPPSPLVWPEHLGAALTAATTSEGHPNLER